MWPWRTEYFTDVTLVSEDTDDHDDPGDPDNPNDHDDPDESYLVERTFIIVIRIILKVLFCQLQCIGAGCLLAGMSVIEKNCLPQLSLPPLP